MTTEIIGIAITETQPNIKSLGILKFLNISGVSTFSNLYCLDVSTFSSINPTRIGMNPVQISQDFNFVSNPNLDSISIGSNLGYNSQNQNYISIGNSIGQTNKGSGSITIGYLAGTEGDNSIILNASGNFITGNSSNSTYLAPIRNQSQTNLIGYDSINKELSYFLNTSQQTSKPILTRINNSTQTLNSGIDKYLVYNSVRTSLSRGAVSISYNSTTGEFINNTNQNKSFFIIVQVSLGFLNSTNNRSIWIESNLNGRISQSIIKANATQTHTHLQTFVSYIISPNENLKVGAFQDSGSNILTGSGSFKDCGIMFLEL
jgi:hypothetical protein